MRRRWGRRIGVLVMTSQMWYNIPVTQSGTGRFLMSSADVTIAYRYWVKHPVLLDSRPADCVTTSASNTGCFAMSAKDGKPCEKCGTNNWYSNGRRRCIECARLYHKEWYEANKEEEKKRVKNWRLSNLDKDREIHRKYRQSNKDNEQRRIQRWGKSNPERMGAIKRKSKAKNYEHSAAVNREWQRANPDKMAASYHKRQAKKKINGGSFTAQEWRELCNRYGGKCLRCGRSDVKLTVDHVLPIDLGGSSDIGNIQPLCKSCNSWKSRRHIDFR